MKEQFSRMRAKMQDENGKRSVLKTQLNHNQSQEKLINIGNEYTAFPKSHTPVLVKKRKKIKRNLDI